MEYDDAVSQSIKEAELDQKRDGFDLAPMAGCVFAPRCQALDLYEASLGNVAAALKASDIFARGVNMMQTALIGSAWMSIDDAIADAHAAMSCRSLPRLVQSSIDNASQSVLRSLFRSCVLGRMAAQWMQDATCPLEQRIVLTFDPPALKAN